MMDVEVLDMDGTDVERVQPGFEIFDIRQPGLGLHREVRRLHLVGNVLGDVLLGLSRTEEVDFPSGNEGRHEERKAGDVIPVIMGEDHRELAHLGLLHQLVAERNDA